MMHDDALAHALRRRRVQGVEQLGQRHRGGTGLTGVGVGAGVGDHQLLGGRPDRVEEQLPVLGAGVALPGHGIAGQHVVAVGDALPREHAVVETDEAHHPMRHRPHRHHRAHRQRAGAEVRARRPPREMAIEQRLHVGQSQHRAGPRARVGQHLAELALHLTGLPRVGIVDARHHRDALGQRLQPVLQRVVAGERVDGPLQPVDELGELTGQLDPVAADVVERQRRPDPRVCVVGHGDAGEYAVDAETPCVVHEVDAVGLAVLLVETPADVRLPHPAGDVLEVVVGEAEAGAHRRGLREVEHLAGGHPAAGQREQLRRDAQQRIGLDE